MAPPLTPPNVAAPLAIVLVDPVSGSAYSLVTGSGGGYLQATTPGATINDWAPTGFAGASPKIGRLDVIGTDVATALNGLAGGSDGQQLVIFNGLATQTLTINSLNVGSAAANQFQGSGNAVLAAGQSKLVMYYAGTVNKWRIIG